MPIITASAFTLLTIIQAPTGTPREIVAEIQTLLASTETKAGMERVEKLLQWLQRSDDPTLAILEPRIEAHAEMLRRHRVAGRGPSTTSHANWLIGAERELRPDMIRPAPAERVRAGQVDDFERRRALRVRHADIFIDAYLTMARLVEAAGDRTKAVWWLQLGERRMYDIDRARSAFKKEMDRTRTKDRGQPEEAGPRESLSENVRRHIVHRTFTIAS